MNDEDYDDDDDFGPIFRIVESKPVTKYTFIQFGFSVLTGALRSVLEATSDLADAFVGAEGHQRNKKQFEDEVRLDLETLHAEGAEDTGE